MLTAYRVVAPQHRWPKHQILNLLIGMALAAAPRAFAAPTAVDLSCQSPALRITFNSSQPGLAALSIDSLQRGEFHPSPLIATRSSTVHYKVSKEAGWVRYSVEADSAHPVWEMRCDGDILSLRTVYNRRSAAQDFVLKFDPDVTHATLLGHVTAGGDIALPALLHLPGMGSLRVSATGNSTAALHYDARRNPARFVAVAFQAATAQNPNIEYRLQTAAIYPAIPGLDPADRRFDGFRRDYLDIFQQQAELHVLANNAASDACAFTLYEYADMARHTPELANGLTALDLVRDSLDRYLSGFLGYGMPGYKTFDDPTDDGTSAGPWVFTDVYPSLLISAYDYADATRDTAWLRRNYAGLRKWTDTMIAANADGSPLLEYPASGNSGSWPQKIKARPANWWDTVGFGHQDAYSNALGYRALRGMAALAERLGETNDTARYRSRAEAIRTAFVPAFLNPQTGVLAGWRSRDGQLHDYYFPFVNGMAVRYGLIDGAPARQVMDRILAEMDKVGYRDFSLGLPGNLIPIRRADYVDLDPRWGGPAKEDGSDGFQIYENGGATACFAYFTVAAFYMLGDKKHGDRMLLPMLEAFARQGFSGRAANGNTYDWKDWHGGAHGYEGFLVDNYYALLAVLDREGMMESMP
jgi:hypothetical protein